MHILVLFLLLWSGSAYGGFLTDDDSGNGLRKTNREDEQFFCNTPEALRRFVTMRQWADGIPNNPGISLQKTNQMAHNPEACGRRTVEFTGAPEAVNRVVIPGASIKIFRVTATQEWWPSGEYRKLSHEWRYFYYVILNEDE